MRGNENITSLTPLDQEIRFKTMLAAEIKVSGSHPERIPEVESACSWKRIMEPVEPFLKAVTEQLMGQARDFDPEIVPYAQHALNNGGKQLRPTLVALAAGCFGEAKAAHVKAAVIIEMVHLATLVHDDILFANALTLAASFPTTDVCRAVSLATNTVCSGEILQTQQRRNFIASRRDYFRVIEMKTGELFTLSCDLAAFLSNAPAAQRAALRAFGASVGTAYQVYDDCVDLFGSEADAGKSLGTDLAKGKLTWPVLLAWERASASNRKLLEQLIAHWEPKNLLTINALLAKYETFEPSVREIGRFLDQARRALRVLPEGPGRAGLTALTDYLAQQTGTLAVQ
jgi:octaprenyl-diphosphate synthase